MSLIHPLKFRTWETGHFKTPRLQTSRLQTGVFQIVVTVAHGHNLGVNDSKGKIFKLKSTFWYFWKMILAH